MSNSWGLWFLNRIRGRQNGRRGSNTNTEIDRPHTLPSTSSSQQRPPSPPIDEITRVFGKSLRDLSRRDDVRVPNVLKQSLDWLNKNACKLEGLWRKPGSVKTVEMWRKTYDRGECVVFDDSSTSPCDVASFIKRFLKDLPNGGLDGGLIPKEFKRELIDAAYCEDDKKRHESFRNVLKKFPVENRETLMYIIRHFHTVHLNRDLTRMNAKNLAMCFMPRLAHGIEMLVIDWKFIEKFVESEEVHSDSSPTKEEDEEEGDGVSSSSKPSCSSSIPLQKSRDLVL